MNEHYLQQLTPQQLEAMKMQYGTGFFLIPVNAHEPFNEIDSVVSVDDSLSTVTSSDESCEKEDDIDGDLYEVLQPTVIRHYPRYDAEVIQYLNAGDSVVLMANWRAEKRLSGWVRTVNGGWIRNLTMRYKCTESVKVLGEEEHTLDAGTYVEVDHITSQEIHIIQPVVGIIKVDGKRPMNRRFKGKPTVALRNIPGRVGKGKGHKLSCSEVCNWVRESGFGAVKAKKQDDGQWHVQLKSLAEAKKILKADLFFGRRKIYSDYTPKFGYLVKLEAVYDDEE